MTFQVSPGVYPREFDLTQVITAATSSVAGFAGNFKWGPLEQVIRVSSEQDALDAFLKPDLSTQGDFLTLSSFLGYSGAAQVVRAFSSTGNTIKNAGSGKIGVSGTVSATATGQTLFNLPPAAAYDIGQTELAVTVNGIVRPFSETSTTSFTLTSPVFNDDILTDVVAYVVTHQDTVTAGSNGQTLFTVDPYTFNGTTQSNITLSIAGVPLVFGVDYDEINATSIELATGVASGTIIAYTITNSGTIAFTTTPQTTFAVPSYGDVSEIKVYVDNLSVAFTNTADVSGGGEGVDPIYEGVVLTLGIYAPQTIEYFLSGVPVQPVSRTLVKNDDHFDILNIVGEDFVAKFPGIAGNSLDVYLVSNAAALADIKAKTLTATGVQKVIYDTIIGKIGRRAPSTTEFASTFGATNDEIHVFVFDRGGRFTGSPGQVLESFMSLSLIGNAKANDGGDLYFRKVINQTSRFIRVASIPAGLSSFTGADAEVGRSYAASADVPAKPAIASVFGYQLAGGNDGPAADDAAYVNAYGQFSNKDTTNIAFLVMGSQGAIPINAAIGIAEARKDVVVFFSPPRNAVVGSTNPLNSVLEFRDALLVSATPTSDQLLASLNGRSTSYAFMDSGWKYMFNKFNGNSVWVPLNGDMAGLAANTDRERDPWYSFAGFNRGIVKNVIKLAWNPNEAQRDELYSAEVNPVVSFPGQGVILFGDKTLQSKPSAFDRINVRRLFIILEKAISDAAKFSLFEFNDQFTRAQFVSLVEPFLRDVKGRRGLTSFSVICDETNNTPAIINSNSFVGDIYIVPNKSINFIRLNFVAVPTGVEFTTIQGQFG